MKQCGKEWAIKAMWGREQHGLHESSVKKGGGREGLFWLIVCGDTFYHVRNGVNKGSSDWSHCLCH